MILCYPKLSSEELERRISELSSLGIVALEFRGSKEVFGVRVLGKGCVGVVVSAQTSTGRVALKILRTDADRAGFDHEASMLRLANSINVGPKLYDFSGRFLVMEHLEGNLLPEWIKTLAGRGRKNRLKSVLRGLLEACYRLDQMGLDHGELSRAPKHIIVGEQDRAEIVDFETASDKRRPSNVTSLCQYLFLGSELSSRVRRILGPIRKATLLGALRKYKKNTNPETFQSILRASMGRELVKKRL
jgi:putative serine/threonine protein kinase